MSTRGAFIVFEGLDRSGKSTQSKNLVEALRKQGKEVKHINFPNRTTTIGGLINSYLQNASELSDQTIHLLFSSNRWEVASQLEKDLHAGINVVCDRYAFSGVSFTAAKGLDFEWCKGPDRLLPAPDKVFFLDIDPEKAQERADFGNERYEKLEFQKKVREQYNKFQDASYWHKLDATRKMEDLTEEILSATNCMGVAQEIARLWPETTQHQSGREKKAQATVGQQTAAWAAS